LSTEVSVDGKKVDSSEAGCLNETCSVNREWTLLSSGYGVGPHAVVVKVTDGVGRSETASVPIEISKDTTKPQIQASGSLFTAPEGWVEQQIYHAIAEVSDSGYGVSQVELKIDGKQVGSASQICPNGGCSLTKDFEVNAAEYPGGSHEAEFVATDGSGNSQTKSWTINVDPDGKISVQEATQTLEAVDATAETAVVAPTSEVLDPEQIEAGDNPGLVLSGSTIESTGVPDVTTMSTSPATGFAIQAPSGTTAISPVVSESASNVGVAEKVSAVAANTSKEADSIVRPEYNGVQTFQAIRSAESPEAYAWQVHLAPHQTLKLSNSSQAEVVYEDGTVAFLITAEQAHDATGTSVPTTLTVSENILTLRVEHQTRPFVYPIVAGQGWETSYTAPVIVKGPEDETETLERIEREREEREGSPGGVAEEDPGPPTEGPVPAPRTQAEVNRLVSYRSFGAPVAAPSPVAGGGGASASVIRGVFTPNRVEVCQIDHCSIWHVTLNAPQVRYGAERFAKFAEWSPGGAVGCQKHIELPLRPILHVDLKACGTFGFSKVWSGNYGQHMGAFGRWEAHDATLAPDGSGIGAASRPALQMVIYPNGYQLPITQEWTPSLIELPLP
jgi:hypothetical protein